ncbi:lytic polysaccharide monooxygenase [Hypoxylon sp. FL1150]|nr:lytic polysaccharide monooxygenase [Hypoxylon sp. FL1150]
MVYAKIAVTAGLVAAVNAHMKMATPAPFDPSALTNAPLDASGSDFPCKFGSGYSATGGTTNTYALGSQQTLSFIGQATHGGGSCQVSITYDTTPTSSSVFKVIHSIEGGCPAKNTSGNLGDDASAEDPYTYPYTIPSDIPAGKATIAWTWFNKVGNREMYMNCGALELTGTGGDQANFDKLPDMLVLNIGGKPDTIESYDYKFQDAGSSVEDNTSAGEVATCGTSGCTVGDTAGSSSSGSSSSDSGSASTAVSSASSAATSAAAASSTTAAAGGVFITQTGSGSSSAATSAAAVSSTAASSPTTTAADTPAATTTAAASSGSSSGSTTSAAQTGACSPEGTFNCMGSSYQQCASGQWSVTMALAAGTSCSGGQSTSLNIAAAGKKRSGRSFRA